MNTLKLKQEGDNPAKKRKFSKFSPFFVASCFIVSHFFQFAYWAERRRKKNVYICWGFTRVKLTSSSNIRTHKFGLEFSPPKRVKFPKLCLILFRCFLMWHSNWLCVDELFLFFAGEEGGSKLKWLWWNINLHKKIITEKETGKLNSLRKEWIIVLEH